MVPSIRKQFFLGCVGERKVPDVMTKSGHAQDTAPVRQLIALLELWQTRTDMVGYVFATGYNVEYTTREFHYAKRMLESLVRCSGVDKIGQGELMDMAQPLESPRVENLPLVAVQPHKRVDRVSDLVKMFRH